MAVDRVSNPSPGEEPKPRLVAIDVETANIDRASICQVGIVTFADGKVETWGSLVNPEDYFDEFNVSIHGIDETMVAGKPKYPEIFEEMVRRLQGQIVVSHMPFDRDALKKACEKYGLNNIKCAWLDSAKVARRTWSQFARRGYGLRKVCDSLGILFKHHDAVEDARAAGEIVLQAMNVTGLDLNGWLRRASEPICSAHRPNGVTALAGSGKETCDANPDGPLTGEEVVFTGTLASMARIEAQTLAARMGCNVADNVRKTTTLLVIGGQDACRLKGKPKSAKHANAEKLVAKGQNIRFLTECDFLRLVQVAQ